MDKETQDPGPRIQAGTEIIYRSHLCEWRNTFFSVSSKYLLSYTIGISIFSRVILEFFMSSFRLKLITIIFRAEIQSVFNIQNNQEKMLKAHDVYKIQVSERLKLLFKHLPIVIYW